MGHLKLSSLDGDLAVGSAFLGEGRGRKAAGQKRKEQKDALSEAHEMQATLESG